MLSVRSWSGWRPRRRCRTGRWCRRGGCCGPAIGVANEEIARRCGVDSDTVRRWRSRFAEQGIGWSRANRKGPRAQAGPATGHRRGSAAADPSRSVPPTGRRTGAPGRWPQRVGIGKDAVAKIWADHNLKPWKVETFKVSNDPRFEEKLVDVVGLYLIPPGAGGGVQLRRKDPMPGVGPHATVAADEAGSCRNHDP